MAKKMLVFFLVAIIGPSVSAFQSKPDKDKYLPFIKIPELEQFEDRMDRSVDEVVGWMNAIEANLLAASYDVQCKAEVFSVSTHNDGSRFPMGWNAALRTSKKPSINGHRTIVVRQLPLENHAIATNRGAADDNSFHRDFLRLGDRMLEAQVKAYDRHVGEVMGESKYQVPGEGWRTLRVFDPIRACSSSVSMVRDGYAQEASTHNVLPATVKAVVEEKLLGQKYTHVYIELSIVKSTNKTWMVYTFEQEVPVQVVHWFELERAGKPKFEWVTRSSWQPVSDGQESYLLPQRVLGQMENSQTTGEMEISFAWRLGKNVDPVLFDEVSLGKIPPAKDVTVGVPLKLDEMVQEYYDAAAGGY